MYRWIKSSLRIKIMMILITISFFPLAIAGTAIFLYASSVIEKDFIQNSQVLLKQIAINLDSHLSNMETLSLMAFTDKNVLEILREDYEENTNELPNKRYKMEGFLNSISLIRKEISGVYIFSENNVYYQYKYNFGVDFDYDYKQDIWYKDALNKKGTAILIGTHKPFQRKTSDEYVFSIARCIIDPIDDRILGVILVDANFNIIKDMCNSTPADDGSQIIITDENGKIIYSPDVNQLTTDIELDIALFDKYNGSKNIKIDAEEYLISYTTSDYSNWKIIQYTPKAVVNKSRNFVGLITTITILNLALLTVLLSIFISKAISRPITKLNDTLMQIGKGNFPVNNPTTRKDEIGQLTLHINEMSSNLQELIMRVSKAQLKQKESELKFLQSQINPHFLYNTLNSIQMKARINKQIEIYNMLENLSSLFKFIMQKENKLVKIEQELEYIRLYVKLQKIRYNDKIEYIENIDQDILNLYTLRFILQPIVENSYYHGLEKKADKGRIEIKGTIKENKVILEVTDDGIGMNKSELDSLRAILQESDDSNEKMYNIGIKNVNDRIKLYYGSNYGVDIDSKECVGTKVVITLPVNCG